MIGGSRGRIVTFVSVMLLCAALVVTTMRWRSSENTVDGLRDAVKAQREAINTNREVVSELCRTNGLIIGLVSEQHDLARTELELNALPTKLVNRYRIHALIYEGFLEQLNQQTACREVVRP